jgi:hypothetical protein
MWYLGSSAARLRKAYIILLELRYRSSTVFFLDGLSWETFPVLANVWDDGVIRLGRTTQSENLVTHVSGEIDAFL